MKSRKTIIKTKSRRKIQTWETSSILTIVSLKFHFQKKIVFKYFATVDIYYAKAYFTDRFWLFHDKF